MRHMGGGPELIAIAIGLYILLTLKSRAIWLPHGQVLRRTRSPRAYWSIIAGLGALLAADVFWTVGYYADRWNALPLG